MFPTGQATAPNSTLLWNGTTWVSAANPVFAAAANPSSVDSEIAIFAGTSGTQLQTTTGFVGYSPQTNAHVLFVQSSFSLPNSFDARFALKNDAGGFVGWWGYNRANVFCELNVPPGTGFHINGGNGVNVAGFIFPAAPNVAPNWQLPNSGTDGAPLRLDASGSQFVLDGVLNNLISTSYGIGTHNGGAAPSIVWATGSKQILNLDQNATVTFGAPFSGTDLTLIVNNAAGAFTVTWPATVLWQNGTPPALNVANSKTKIEFFFDGTHFWGTYQLNFA
jgi:hypothetical protein